MSHAAALQTQPRPRALAALDAEIDRAERTSARCRLDLKDALATGRGVVRTEGMLRLAEQRLARLRGAARPCSWASCREFRPRAPARPPNEVPWPKPPPPRPPAPPPAAR